MVLLIMKDMRTPESLFLKRATRTSPEIAPGQFKQEHGPLTNESVFSSPQQQSNQSARIQMSPPRAMPFLHKPTLETSAFSSGGKSLILGSLGVLFTFLGLMGIDVLGGDISTTARIFLTLFGIGLTAIAIAK